MISSNPHPILIGLQELITANNNQGFITSFSSNPTKPPTVTFAFRVGFERRAKEVILAEFQVKVKCARRKAGKKGGEDQDPGLAEAGAGVAEAGAEPSAVKWRKANYSLGLVPDGWCFSHMTPGKAQAFPAALPEDAAETYICKCKDSDRHVHRPKPFSVTHVLRDPEQACEGDVVCCDFSYSEQYIGERGEDGTFNSSCLHHVAWSI
jgi:hypothetical protein